MTCFCAHEIFSSKKKINRLEIVLIALIYNTIYGNNDHTIITKFLKMTSNSKKEQTEKMESTERQIE